MTYKGRVAVDLDHERQRLTAYLTAYRTTVWKCLKLFRTMIEKNGGSELLAYLIIQPTKVPAHIHSSEAWSALGRVNTI